MAEYEYTKSRIIDEPEAEELKDDDYILIQSEEDGMRCYKVKNLLGGSE